MGLLDAPIFTNLVKVSDGTLSGTGDMVYFNNKNGYNTLAIVLKVTEGSDNTGDFGISFGIGDDTNVARPVVYDEQGMVYENFGHPKYFISKSNFSDFNSIASPFTQTKIFFVDITGIDKVRARVEYCNGSFTFDYSVYRSRGNFIIPDYKPIQKLGSFVRTGDGTTSKNFGGTSAMAQIPSGFKYVFVDVAHTDSEGNMVRSDFDVTMYFTIKRHKDILSETQSITAEKIIATATNMSYITSDYQEVKGNKVLCHVNFDTAPASGDKIYITYFGVR